MDGLVHTCTVVYSLLAELKPKDRAEYKGITKKELRVPVQRLVLILPIEEAEIQKDEETVAGATSEPAAEHSDEADGYAEASEKETNDEAVELKVSD